MPLSSPPHAASENATTTTRQRVSLTAATVSPALHVVCERIGSYAAPVALSTWLDRVLYRHPFEGASARRYATQERPAFGDLDDRLLDGMAEMLASARWLLELGAGPASFARRAAVRHPHLTVLAVEPSRDFARPHPPLAVVRAAGEGLPLAGGSVDVAVCLSSIR